MATQQAAQLGVNDMFYISAGIFVALIVLIWITRPERAGGALMLVCFYAKARNEYSGLFLLLCDNQPSWCKHAFACFRYAQ